MGARPATSNSGTAVSGRTAIEMGPCLSVNRISNRPPVMPHIELPNDSHPVPVVLKPRPCSTVGPQLVRK